jgi:hypothetical protein
VSHPKIHQISVLSLRGLEISRSESFVYNSRNSHKGEKVVPGEDGGRDLERVGGNKKKKGRKGRKQGRKGEE